MRDLPGSGTGGVVRLVAIISFSRKFIFLKTAKTAGTSLEVYLSQHCDDGDIVTPIFPANPNHVPRNFHNSRSGTTLYNHMAAAEVQNYLGQEQFSRFFKFCFERHPVDKCISHFAMLKNSPAHKNKSNPKTWEEYLESGAFPNNAGTYTDEGGNLLVDKIYKFELLPQAIKEICDKVDLPHIELNVFEKSGFRHGVPDFGEVMRNAFQKNKIMKAFDTTLRFVHYV